MPISKSSGMVARGSISIGIDQLQKQRTVAIKTAQEIGEGFKQSFIGADKAQQSFVSNGIASIKKYEAILGKFNVALFKARRTQGLPLNFNDKQLLKAVASLEKVETAAQRAERQLKKTFTATTPVVNNFNQSLQSTSARLQQIQGELTAVSLAGAAFVTLGLRAADNLQNLQIRYRELAGDQERGLALMEEIGTAAAALNLPIRETQSSFAGLVPAIREAGGEVEVYVNRIARLATINTQEGVAGAVFAVREALTSGGTDLVSLAERFNLPRRRLRELVEETGDFAEALDIVLNEQGATNAALESFSGNLNTATTRLRDAATRGLERAFLPQLEMFTNLINSAADGVNALPDGVLAFAGGAITATTATVGLALALSQVLDVYQKLKVAGAFAPGGIGRTAIAGGLLAGTVAAAPNLVNFGVTNFGRATGDERLSNLSVDETNEEAGLRIRQVGLLILEAGRYLAHVIANIVTPFATIPGEIERFKGHFQRATGELIISIGTLAQTIANLLPGTGLSEGAQSIIDAGELQVSLGQLRIDAATQVINATSELTNAAIDTVFDEWQNEYLNFSGLVQKEANETRGVLHKAFGDTQHSVDQTMELVEAGLAGIAERIQQQVASIESAIQFETEINQLERNGSVDQVISRVQSLENERNAIRTMLPELEALADGNNEAAQSLRNYQARIQEIDQQIGRLADITPELAQRAMADLSEQFANDVRVIEDTRSQAMQDLTSKLNADLSELDSDVVEKFRDARQEEIEAVAEFHEARQEIEEEHQKRLLEIERDGREEIIDAAGQLDAAGVLAAIRARQKERDEAKERFEEENERNQERLTDIRENLSEERQEILDNYNERRNDLIIAAQAERQAIQNKYQQELNTRVQAFNAEAQLLNQYSTLRLKQQSSALSAELQNQKTGYEGMIQGANRFAQALTSIGRGLGQAAGSVGSAISSTTRTGGIVIPALSSAPIGVSNSLSGRSTTVGSSIGSGGTALSGASIARFNDGGIANFSGSGEALAFVRDKERVLSPQQTANFDRFVSMLSNIVSGGGASRDVSNISVDVSGVDSFEMLVENVTRQVLGQLYQQQIAGKT